MGDPGAALHHRRGRSWQSEGKNGGELPVRQPDTNAVSKHSEERSSKREGAATRKREQQTSRGRQKEGGSGTEGCWTPASHTHNHHFFFLLPPPLLLLPLLGGAPTPVPASAPSVSAMNPSYRDITFCSAPIQQQAF